MSRTYQVLLLVAGVLFFAWLAFGGKSNDTEEVATPLPAPVAGGPLFNPKVPAPVPTAGIAPAGAPGLAAGPLNPAHGQPGHRCDIAVGAPLSSPATSPGANVTAPSPVVSPSPVTAPPPPSPISLSLNQPASGGTAGKNPAHGQPGHRCDIAVGAPLDSKPTAQPSTTNASPQTVVTPAKSPVSPLAPVVTAPGKNPPHGQPGHRCDIAVGASLDSAAKQ